MCKTVNIFEILIYTHVYIQFIDIYTQRATKLRYKILQGFPKLGLHIIFLNSEIQF